MLVPVPCGKAYSWAIVLIIFHLYSIYKIPNPIQTRTWPYSKRDERTDERSKSEVGGHKKFNVTCPYIGTY